MNAVFIVPLARYVTTLRSGGLIENEYSIPYLDVEPRPRRRNLRLHSLHVEHGHRREEAVEPAAIARRRL